MAQATQVKNEAELKGVVGAPDAIVPFSANYKKGVSSGSYYTYQPILPDKTEVKLGGGAGQTNDTTIFKIPSKNVYNLARSKFRFNVLVGAGTAFTKMRMDLPLIDSIIVEVDGVGNKFLELTNFPIYWMQTRCAYPDSKFRTHNPIGFAADLATARAKMGVCRYHNPAGAATSTAIAALNNNCEIVAHNAVAASTERIARVGSFHDTAVQMLASSATGAAISYVAEISGDQLVETIFSMDKNLYVPGGLTITINWGISGRVWGSDAVATIHGTPAAYTGTLTISSLSLDLCKETNEHVIQDLKNLVNSRGLNIAYPVAYTNVSGSLAVGDGAPVLKIQPGNGRNLLRVYASEMITNALNGSFNMNNVNGAKTTKCRHAIDGKYLDQVDLNPVQHRDYLAVEHLFSGSANNYSAAEFYQYAPVYIANFANIRNLAEAENMNFVGDGMPIDKSSEFVREVTVTAACSTVFTLVCQKEMLLMADTASQDAGAAQTANPN